MADPDHAVTDYEETFEDFWREIVCNEDGTLNVDAVKRELYDYSTLLINVPKVYDHVTGGRISKPHTLAFEVIGCFDEYVNGLLQDPAEEKAQS